MPTAPTAPKAEDTEAKAKKAAEQAALAEWQGLVARATEGDTPGSRQVARAIRLEGEISKVREHINDNRDYLRLMDKNEELNEAQSEFLDTFYPEKEKGERRPTEEVEATRRARAAARKNGA